MVIDHFEINVNVQSNRQPCDSVQIFSTVRVLFVEHFLFNILTDECYDKNVS